MNKPRHCDRKPCGEPAAVNTGAETLCWEHFESWVDEDHSGEFDDLGRRPEVMRNARAM